MRRLHVLELYHALSLNKTLHLSSISQNLVVENSRGRGNFPHHYYCADLFKTEDLFEKMLIVNLTNSEIPKIFSEVPFFEQLV